VTAVILLFFFLFSYLGKHTKRRELASRIYNAERNAEQARGTVASNIMEGGRCIRETYIRATAAAKTKERGIAQRTAAEHGSLGTSDNLWFSPRFLYSNLSV